MSKPDEKPPRVAPPFRARRLTTGVILNPRHARVETGATLTQKATGDQRARGKKV